ncbi:hypothetical protein [Pontibacter chitinilyticus]|uniref:hypothetical protein n=1 Tax=Pontibacter chitinilyticus TaxID=2674989 RepID=UPI00321938EB
MGGAFIAEEDAYNFTLYSKKAEKVRLLLFREDMYEEPVATYDFDPRIHKLQRVWGTTASGVPT